MAGRIISVRIKVPLSSALVVNPSDIGTSNDESPQAINYGWNPRQQLTRTLDTVSALKGGAYGKTAS